MNSDNFENASAGASARPLSVSPSASFILLSLFNILSSFIQKELLRCLLSVWQSKMENGIHRYGHQKLFVGLFATTAVSLAATKTITMTTIQKTLITAALVIATGTGLYEARDASELRDQVQILQEQPTAYLEQYQRLQRERDEATNRLAAANAEIAQLTHQLQRQEVSPHATADD
jgi:hypothetical protein